MRLPILIAAALLPAALIVKVQAGQPDQPPLLPTRDVSVSYDVQPEGAPASQRVRVYFAANGDLMRIDSPDGKGATILDRDKQLMTIVMNTERVYMQIAERHVLRSPFLLDPSMRFTASGHGSVVGLACNQWNITAQSGGADACITDDGVILKEEGVDQEGARGKLIATAVQYGPLGASTFAPPPDYARIAHPEGPGAYERGGNPSPALGQ